MTTCNVLNAGRLGCLARELAVPAASVVVLLLALVAACATVPGPDLSGMTFTSEPLVGKVIWRDLITEDIDAARRFYGGLFGWEFEESKGADGRRYVLARHGNVYVSGIVPVASPGDGMRLSRWLPYVSVADVDAAVARSASAGAAVAVAARNVNLGRVAAIVDPEGAVLGFAQSDIGDPDDRTTAGAPGRPVWSELLSDDPEAAAAFYRSVVGYEVRRIARRGGTYTILGSAGVDRAGILANPTTQWRPLWLTYFAVSDPEAAAERARELGGRILLKPSPQIREGSMAVVTDPSGAVLVLQRFPG
jgi:predicted enzyme related to lactoylglutathione lyase